MCSVLLSTNMHFIRHDSQKSVVLHSLFPSPDSMSTYVTFYKTTIQALIKDRSYKLPGLSGTRVDLVRNVINVASVHWAAYYLTGLPLKTQSNPGGMFTEQEVYDIFSLLFTAVFLNFQPEHGWELKTSSAQVGAIVSQLIEKSINEASPGTAPVSGTIT